MRGYKCDRCRRFDVSGQENTVEVGRWTDHARRYDLCPSCTSDLTRFLTEGPAQPAVGKPCPPHPYQ